MKKMKKKKIFSILGALLATMLLISAVYAGTTSDRGTLATNPPAGQANYFAWLGDANTVPNQIQTEDSFNAMQGLDTGYTDAGWAIQVPNFNNPAPYDTVPVNFSFGGINLNKGKHWYTRFEWEGGGGDPTATFHGELPLSTSTGPACPTRYPAIQNLDGTRDIPFFGQPLITYQIYRTTTPSGAGNGEGNGRYTKRATVTTDAYGNGIYHDAQVLPAGIYAWYEILYFDTTGAGLHGCHSEPVSPTAVEVTDFTAAYQFETNDVKLSWTTVIETDILGFNLYRSEGVSGERVKINAEPIPAAHPGSLDGATYPLTDGAVEVGHSYHYWLEVQRLNGTSFTIKSNEVMLGVRIYIPLISR